MFGVFAAAARGECRSRLWFAAVLNEKARSYSIGFDLEGEAWVAWMVDVVCACLRVCKGLVAFVVEGQTNDFRWSATPALLMADLHRRGVHLRKPPIFSRVGIPGSGGPDWLRNDYEFILCTTRGGRLPWSDNTAMGHPPKWAPGGEMSHRISDGSRVNQWGHAIESGATVVAEGGALRSKGKRPSHKLRVNINGQQVPIPGWATSGHAEGDTPNDQGYHPPVLANPGNIIYCNVGGGQMDYTSQGSRFASRNEAPFPAHLAEFFILSFCQPGGIVADCFSGSGTTAAMAKKHGRNFRGCDIRQSQVDLTLKRLSEENQLLFT